MNKMGESKVDVMRLSLADAARLLGVDREVVEQDVRDGLPTNADGTISLVTYGAWLNAVCKQSEGTRREPEGRVPEGCGAEGGHNLLIAEGGDAES